MTLRKYAKKRNFKKTSEPKGKKGASRSAPIFVVQKHAASRLHYDLRLEHRGVLKSWAVPKGPTLDPREKRLAMMVEDHPYDYKDFEGVIPEGNYGAGKVIVWDRGTYFSGGVRTKKEISKNFERGLEKGDLKFELAGEKLKGNYALVKIKKDKTGKSWLLIKKNDPAAGQKIKNAGASVVSGKTLEEIGKKADPAALIREAKKRFPGKIKKENLPEFLKPMTARLAGQPFSSPEWIYEIKWDGFRGLGLRAKKRSKLLSRNKVLFNERFFPIAEDLKKIKTSVILDGEIVALDEEGHPRFQLVQNWFEERQGALEYKVFDILHLAGYGLRQLPLVERKKMLFKFLENQVLPTFRFVDHIEENGREFFVESTAAGLEGIVAKKKDSRYESGTRSENWLKIKKQRMQDAVIGGYTQPRGARKHLGALILGIYEDKQLKYIGHAGGGFDEKKLADLEKMLARIGTKTAPFRPAPKTNMPARWVRPQYVVEVKFSEWSRDGLMRQPVFIRLRDDKDPEEVILEKPLKKKYGRKKKDK